MKWPKIRRESAGLPIERQPLRLCWRWGLWMGQGLARCHHPHTSCVANRQMKARTNKTLCTLGPQAHPIARHANNAPADVALMRPSGGAASPGLPRARRFHLTPGNDDKGRPGLPEGRDPWRRLPRIFAPWKPRESMGPPWRCRRRPARAPRGKRSLAASPPDHGPPEAPGKHGPTFCFQAGRAIQGHVGTRTHGLGRVKAHTGTPNHAKLLLLMLQMWPVM